jgi:hypothetical protein
MATLLPRRALLAALVLTLTLASLNVGLATAGGGECVDLSGCWNCGSWKSCCTDHHGKLRATIERCGPCTYQCTFSGTFMAVVPFKYRVPLRMSKVENGVVHFSARKKIPLFGGDFTCCGTATACKFTARYTSPKDHGYFRMSR